MADEQHLVAEAGDQRRRVEGTAGESRLKLWRWGAGGRAGQLGRLAGTHLRARQAGVELDAEPLQHRSGGAGLGMSLLGQRPLGVGRAVGGVPVAQQPDHDRQDNEMEPDVETDTRDHRVAGARLHRPLLNRELSWLQFNERVLELAEDERIPLLERVKFLAIYASNLDEFYMVRVAGLHDQVDAGIDDRKADGLSPSETIERVADRRRELGRRHSRQWEDAVRPALAEEGIRVIDCDDARRRRSWRASTATSTSRSSRC